MALGSSFFVGIDAEYFDYIDYDTLIVLFCLMVTIEGLRSQGLFEYVAASMLRPIKSRQGAVLLIMALGFFSSMLITNDVALITFVPFHQDDQNGTAYDLDHCFIDDCRQSWQHAFADGQSTEYLSV